MSLLNFFIKIFIALSFPVLPNQSFTPYFSQACRETFRPKPKVEGVLQMIEANNKPPNEFFGKGNQIANDIFNVLQNSRNDIDRYLIVGSAGRGTAVGNQSDIDVLIYLRGKEPSFGKILQEFNETLNQQAINFEDYEFGRLNELLLRIKVAGIQFDLLPATNYENQYSNQFFECTKIINSLPNPVIQNYRYHQGLWEEGVKFAKKQSEFAMTVTRLAKYWNNQIYISEFSQGNSYIMELVALQSSEGVPGNDIYLAFKQFLFTISNFEHMIVYFEELYKKSDIPSFIMNYRGPIVLCPTSYYRNIIHHWSIPKSIALKYKSVAKTSLQELENWMSDPCADEQSFNKVFCKNVSLELCRDSSVVYPDRYSIIANVGTCENDDYYTWN